MSQSDFVSRGHALVTSGQYQEAVKVCRLGLLGRPTTVDGRIVLGQALLALKRYDEVLAEMRVALDLDHGSAAALLLRAEALLKKGEKAQALEALETVRAVAPKDPTLARLTAEARSAAPLSSSQRAVGFVGNARGASAAEESTRHYPSHVQGMDDDEDEAAEAEETGGTDTRPRSLAAPTAAKRSGRQQAPRAETPSPDVLAVGDHSGTVELDPEHEGVELAQDDDFGDVVAPPSARGNAAVPPAPAPQPRAAMQPASKGAGKPQPVANKDESSIELSRLDILEVDENQKIHKPVGSTAVRKAVSMPSGPLDAPVVSLMSSRLAPTPASTRKTEPAPLAMPLGGPVDPRSAIAAALPTAMAMPMPQLPSPIAAALPTVNAVRTPEPPLGMPFDNGGARPQPWAQPTMMAQAQAQPAPAPSRVPETIPPIDPRMAVELGPQFADGGSNAAGQSDRARRGRSRLSIVLWVFVGALLIGGGVFAGFQIRALRLGKQIANARSQANELSAADTYAGWTGARDRLAGVAQASATIENRAALARARALLAYEFGDGLADAKRAVEKLDAGGGLDGALAAGYVALAASDGAAAKAAANKALAGAANDGAALYVSGQAALLEGDYKVAIEKLRGATERDARPLYGVGLARALGQTNAWEDALAAVDRVLAKTPEQPAAVIERALLMAASGRIVKGNPASADVRTQLTKLIADSAKTTEPAHSASPAQVALANVALAQVDFALGDLDAVRADLSAALALNQDEPKFAEEMIETLYMINNLAGARSGVTKILTTWPTSHRARITHAQILVAMGKPAEALELFSAHPEAAKHPRGQAVRGLARFSTGDVEGARADFDVVLKKYPMLEVALVGRAWVDLAADEIDQARARIEPRFTANSNKAGLATAYAAILRAAGDPASLDRAKQTLERIVAGPVSVDVPRAQLELARVLRDLGDTRTAKNYFAEATRNGNTDARLELALLQIDDRDPAGGRDTLDALIKDVGPGASASLLLEGARARMLVGDHPGAAELLDRAEKMPSVLRWRLERERARLLLRKGDYAGAASLALKAVDGAGSDPETFVIAADIVAMDPKGGAALAARLKTLVDQRLRNVPEGLIVTGKLAIAAEAYDVAEASYTAAVKALEKATPRRLAQAHFGLAVVAYNKGDDPSAQAQLDLVREEDPSIYGAYLFAAEIAKAKPPQAFALVQKAVTFNPDYVDGWYMVGIYASKLDKKKELGEAIARLGTIAPGSDQLKELEGLK
ncbi:MAG: tetratricopeptide repeat protein [Kofleriaceae bacterium]|nr:tetratricopeptide repeat protein [Kofleriaceae bacterium]